MKNKTELYSIQDDNSIKIEVRLEEGTVWLTQSQIVTLFESSKANISEHINNVFKSEDLDEASAVRKFRTTAADGKKYNVKYYNLDVINSVGYKMNSDQREQFRVWADRIIEENRAIVTEVYLGKELSVNTVGDRIYYIRGVAVMLDRDLADFYQTETRTLKQAVKRNTERFPSDFMFELNNADIESMVSQSVIPSSKYFGGAKPYAFTEQGVSMLSAVIRTSAPFELSRRWGML
ncbi:MAG: RhuM family protein [Kiritimatiellae bacterium]|jgi:ketosteroid isomerase-like protein|nr:RhuM family protein [Kiritimatiellia bacterium]